MIAKYKSDQKLHMLTSDRSLRDYSKKEFKKTTIAFLLITPYHYMIELLAKADLQSDIILLFLFVIVWQ